MEVVAEGWQRCRYLEINNTLTKHHYLHDGLTARCGGPFFIVLSSGCNSLRLNYADAMFPDSLCRAAMHGPADDAGTSSPAVCDR